MTKRRAGDPLGRCGTDGAEIARSPEGRAFIDPSARCHGVDDAPTTDLRQLVARHRAQILALARRFGASNVRIFGSVARGDAGPASDVDLLVEFAPDRSLLDHVGLELALQDLLGVKVDVVSEPALHRVIRDDVLREAVPV